jgi:thiol-disulfide isomerase/thioredoxin
MRRLIYLLLFPLAVFAQSVGDTAQQVEQSLGRPQFQRTTEKGQIWMYRNGTKVTFENGIVRQVSFRSGTEAPEADSARGNPSAAKPGNRDTGVLHKSILGDCRDALVKAGGATADAQPLMQKRFLFIYFSAHWCPPCRAFTPRLVEFYNQNFGTGDFDLLFVSGDRGPEAMDAYMSDTNMPWAGIKFGHTAIAALHRKFGVSGIPCLVLLNEKDEVLASSFKGETYLGPQVALQKYAALHGN